MQLQRNLLQVEDDIRGVLDDPGDRRELMEHAVDLDRGDGRAFYRRQQHSPQRVANRRPEAPFERLSVKAPEPIRQGLALELQTLRPLKTFPQHSDFLSPNGPADGPPDLQVRHRPLAAGLCKAAGR